MPFLHFFERKETFYKTVMKSPSAESVGLNLGKISIMAFWVIEKQICTFMLFWWYLKLMGMPVFVLFFFQLLAYVFFRFVTVLA